MKPTIAQFEEVASNCEGVEFYGKYKGRFYYEGIAISADSSSYAASFIVAMNEDGYRISGWDHQDQLGLGVIVAWNENNFATKEDPWPEDTGKDDWKLERLA